jgi:hypothetical protein
MQGINVVCQILPAKGRFSIRKAGGSKASRQRTTNANLLACFHVAYTVTLVAETREICSHQVEPSAVLATFDCYRYSEGVELDCWCVRGPVGIFAECANSTRAAIRVPCGRQSVPDDSIGVHIHAHGNRWGTVEPHIQ